MKNSIPCHIAIMMDGNRRWARSHGLPELMGHKRVADDILEPLIEHAARIGIKYLTLWAWSTENWNRKKEDVDGVMELFRRVIKSNWKRLSEKGVRIRVIGDITKFPKDIQQSLNDVVEETKHNTKITTIFALNYGGRDEIRRAIQKAIRQKSLKNGISDDWMLTTESFSQFLDTSGIPDPELIIRTGGEERLSGFLLWQSEYSELYFPKFFMPDFTPEKLDEAVSVYEKRQRRFGV